MINGQSDLREKKLRGSGGYVLAKISDEEQKKGNLGGPELFLAGIGRLEEDRISKYYCNKCEKDYEGSPAIDFENPDEELGEGVILVEKGEYKCKTCNGTIAQYRKFNSPSTQVSDQDKDSKEDKSYSDRTVSSDKDTITEQGSYQISTNDHQPEKQETRSGKNEFIPISSLVGMAAYDSDAMYVGKVSDIGLRRSYGKAHISIKISQSEKANSDSSGNSSIQASDMIEVPWNNISKIGDIVLLADRTQEDRDQKDKSQGTAASTKCPSCGYQNDAGALFCEECGTKIRA